MKYFNLILILVLFAKSSSQPAKSDNFSEQSKVILDQFKIKNDVEGLAFAIFTNDSIVFQECLGISTYKYPISNKTLFSIQSISKNVTALATMIAVQEGMLDLDTPISQYLPSFKVNSCFEINPEQKITLRMLLSHTAGFTHEAPIGNNFDYSNYTPDDHCNSIEKTWLKFPAGTDYYYSNMGFDLVAKIIETKSGLKYNDYLKVKIFDPLEMEFTTIDNNEFLANKNKTEGAISSTKTNHYNIPLLGSGAIYTNLIDFIKYVKFQMNLGHLKSKTLIGKEYLLDMYKIRFNHYGFGTYIDKSDSVIYINHNGSGYGYSGTFLWFPEFNLGTILLCNNQVNTFDVCETIMKNYIKSLKSTNASEISDEIKELNSKYFENPGLNDNVAIPHCSNDTVFKSEWKKYIGTYSMYFKGMQFKWFAKFAFALGYKPQKLEIFKENNALRIKSNYGESILREYKTGLFFTNSNEMLDFNNLTYQNVKIKD